jgi:hypothetical protein
MSNLSSRQLSGCLEGKLKMKTVFALSALMMIATPALAEEVFQVNTGYWVCKSSGYGGTRGQWHDFTGARKSTKQEAKASAAQTCKERHFNACWPAGCWYHDEE